MDDNFNVCPVGTFGELGASPYGLFDCAGNESEWTSYWASEFDDYEFYIYEQWASGNYDPIPGPNPGCPLRKIVRGGDYFGPEYYQLAFARSPGPIASGGAGFRVVFDE